MDSCVKACVVIGDVQAEVLHHTEKWVEDAYNDNAQIRDKQCIAQALKNESNTY